MKTLNENALYQLLQEQISQNKTLTATINALRIQLSNQNETIQNLHEQLAKLQNLLFGQKSEKQPRKDKLLESPKPTRLKESKEQEKTNANKNGRRQLPLTLERQKIRYEIPEAERKCPQCPGTLHCIGKEVTEQLDYIPAKLIAKEHIRYKYGCNCCKRYLITAPMPEQPIDKGLAGAGLLAEVLINKYEDALPLYRQQKRWARLGYELPRSTLCDWVMQCASRLKPIVEAMTKQCLLPARKIHTDDTPFPILAEGKTHTGRLWVYVGSADNAPLCTIYQYSKSRSQQVPCEFFKNYQGYLQADAYPGYNKLYQSGRIIEVACWAHARRKFTDAVKLLKNNEGLTLADAALEYIGKLYGIEKRCRSMSNHERYFYRRRFAKPILRKLHRWLNKQIKNTPPKSLIGQAMQYTLNHWKALNNYLRDGVLNIDNNQAERAIKPFVIGRKNFLFAGSHQGAEHAAVIYSLIESCKKFHINTFDYLKDVLQSLPTTLNKDIASLFPCYWKPVK